jgi:hypothetical protein
MAERYEYPFVKKVMLVAIVLWTGACGYMYWSMPRSSQQIRIFFLILYLLPSSMMLVLLAVSRWYAIHGAPAPLRGLAAKKSELQKKKLAQKTKTRRLV